MHTLLRALAVVLLAVVLPAVSSATAAYYVLEDSTWTDPQPAPAAPIPTTQPTPAAPTPTPAVPRSRWPLGSCLDAGLQPVPCTTPGALRIVGVIQQPGQTPCADIPETTHVRHQGEHALCLTTRP